MLDVLSERFLTGGAKFIEDGLAYFYPKLKLKKISIEVRVLTPKAPPGYALGLLKG